MIADKGFGQLVTIDVVLFFNCQVVVRVVILMAFDMPIGDVDWRAFLCGILDREIDISIVASSIVWSDRL